MTFDSPIGYARVSTLDQDLDGQVARLTAEGCGGIRSEKISGDSGTGRAELGTAIEFMRHGDGLIVTRLDRLGRDTRDVLNIIHEVEQRGAFVTIVDPHVSTQGPTGHVMLTVLGMVAQTELCFTKERQREGIGRAKADGIYADGQRRLDRSRVVVDEDRLRTADQAIGLAEKRLLQRRVIPDPGRDEVVKPIVGTPSARAAIGWTLLRSPRPIRPATSPGRRM